MNDNSKKELIKQINQITKKFNDTKLSNDDDYHDYKYHDEEERDELFERIKERKKQSTYDAYVQKQYERMNELSQQIVMQGLMPSSQHNPRTILTQCIPKSFPYSLSELEYQINNHEMTIKHEDVLIRKYTRKTKDIECFFEQQTFLGLHGEELAVLEEAFAEREKISSWTADARKTRGGKFPSF